jgi:hypothetical protein
MAQKNVALLGDLTALFHARQKHQKRIDYKALDSNLKRHLGVKEFAFTKFFTSFHPSNETQVDFLKLLKQFDWNVDTFSPQDIRKEGVHSTAYRFDACIAYELGNIVSEREGKDGIDKVVILSDSFDLARPIMDASQFLDVSLAYYSDVVDPRYWKIINSSKNELRFLDLEELNEPVAVRSVI